MIYILMICSFAGGAMYDCDEGRFYEDVYACEQEADLVSESKNLDAYCIAVDDELPD